MDVLMTRALRYIDEGENSQELILTVFKPFEVEECHWKCGFVTAPPIRSKVIYGVGFDFFSAFVECLGVVRLYFETFERSRRVHWQGLPDCGLPGYTDEQALLDPKDVPFPVNIAGSTDVLATRAVGYWGEDGVEKELRLTVFVPSKAEGDMWTCGFTFDPAPFTSIRYGAGTDSLEALLDSLAKARMTYEGMRPNGCEPLDLNCDDLPYKVGRSFWRDRVREPFSDAPDLSAG